MLSFSLPDAQTVSTVAAELGDAGLDLIPAAVAAMVLLALSAALIITALRRTESERGHAGEAFEEQGVPRPEKVPA